MSLYTMIERDVGGLGASDIDFIRIIWKEYLSNDAKSRKRRIERHKAIRDILKEKRQAENIYLGFRL